MHGGIVQKILIDNCYLKECSCGHQPQVIWHYITGIANHINYFVQCSHCKVRTRHRKSIDGAIQDWNELDHSIPTIL